MEYFSVYIRVNVKNISKENILPSQQKNNVSLMLFNQCVKKLHWKKTAQLH